MINRSGRVCLDANVFIYLIEGEAPYADVARRLLRGSPWRAERAFFTSELTLAEVLAPPKSSNRSSASRQQDFLDAIVSNPIVELMPITREILYESVEVRRSVKYKIADAIYCATAVLAGCKFLVSNDRGMKRLPGNMTWLGVNETTVETLTGTRDAR